MYRQISCEQARQLQQAGACQVLDIRDQQSFNNSHPQGAMHLSNDNFAHFLSTADKALPTLVFCYHGISSQQVATMLVQQGFSDVYSVNGGAEQWILQYPEATDRG